MANKHLKENTEPPAKNAAPKHTKATREKKPPKKSAKQAETPKPDLSKRDVSLEATKKIDLKEIPLPDASRADAPKKKSPRAGKPKGEKKPKEEKQPAKEQKSVAFRQEQTPEERLSRRDRRRAGVTFLLAAILFTACIVMWFYRESFDTDNLILSADKVAVAKKEYIFNAGAGQIFAPVGSGFAVATTSGLELIDADGQMAASKLLQMENPAIASCGSYAVFYDLGGTSIAAARFDGTVRDLECDGGILSVTVSTGGYLCVTTEGTGYRTLVTVYDSDLDAIYEWYSSSAWVISAIVSPDNSALAVLSYTASGSEVRFFRLDRTEQQATFAASDTVLLDVQWLSTTQLCAYSSSQALFFSDRGQWLATYSFAGQYLTGCTFGGTGCVTFSLSPYRAGTTATLVTLDAGGSELGTAQVQSEIVSLSALETEVLVLCPDGAILYSSSLSEKGRLTGLTGFKYGILRSRGEALLISSNYAELYNF